MAEQVAHRQAGLHNDVIIRSSSGWAAAAEDMEISENRQFRIPVIRPQGKPRGNILMLHGLNERSWHKYLPWAKELCTRTGFAVLLVPAAFHIDRSPTAWSSIRKMKPLEQQRRFQASTEGLSAASVSFVNAALSRRIDDHPERFITSGYQTMEDIRRLIEDIRGGRLLPLLEPHLPVHLFAYSIGCSIAQALLIADAAAETALFPPSSRAVFFCGGIPLTDAHPVSPYILDAPSFQQLNRFLRSLAGNDPEALSVIPRGIREDQSRFSALQALCDAQAQQKKRQEGLKPSSSRCLYIPLEGDQVFPPEAVHRHCSGSSAEVFHLQPGLTSDHVRPFPRGKQGQAAMELMCGTAAQWYGC